ncbi:MAG: hypothetical protein JSS82_11410 [Bacteroidetes bacterium]|nr:hypothetical protein [Bacteroidota bacterium]
MSRAIRIFIALCGCGWVWYAAMQCCFVWSGAQTILANPKYQSAKFIGAFTGYQPLPRMANDKSVLWTGFMIIGFIVASAFLLLNDKMKGGRMKKGLLFGIVHWMLMTPWFEFYLPYNVMNEPLSLVLLEGVLWLCVTLIVGLFLSFTMNFGGAEPVKRAIIKDLTAKAQRR